MNHIYVFDTHYLVHNTKLSVQSAMQDAGLVNVSLRSWYHWAIDKVIHDAVCLTMPRFQRFNPYFESVFADVSWLVGPQVTTMIDWPVLHRLSSEDVFESVMNGPAYYLFSCEEV